MIGGMEGWVAVVTGGASGIGEATVALLRECGTEVQVVDRAGEPPRDVTDRQALDELAGEIAARHGRLDILVNAAGILTVNAPVDELGADDFRRNFEVNLLGVFQAAQAFAPLLKAARGSVVNVASQAASYPCPSRPPTRQPRGPSRR